MTTGSTFSPLRHRSFLMLWLATLSGNVAIAIEGVGASWAMVGADGRAHMVALVQTSAMLPIMLLALPAGAVADLYETRRVMALAQLTSACLAGTLALMAHQGAASALVLIGMTLGIGVCAAFYNPAVQATVGDTVPRADLAGAVSLNILGFNVARTIGPAFGGLIITAASAAASFLCGALAALAAALLLLASPVAGPRRRPERPVTLWVAMAEPLRYVFREPRLRRLMISALAFTLSGSAIWGLMPLVARDLVGGGSDELGFLLAALGLGAVLGASTSHGLRRRFGMGLMVKAAAIFYGLGCLAVSAAPGFAATLMVLIFGGAAWVQALSTFSVAAQIWSPRSLVGRITAVLSIMTFGGVALGSWMWGHLVDASSIRVAIATSGAATILVVVIGVLARRDEDQGRPVELESDG